MEQNANNAAANPEEVDTEDISMEALLEQSEVSLDMPRPGEVRTGVIASVSGEEVLVSIGAKSEGVIPQREIALLSDEDREKLQVGKEIEVFVISPDSRQGTMILSITRAMEEDDWTQAAELLKSKDTYEGEISGFNKGGLIVNMGLLRGFVPASQVSMSRRMAYDGDSPDEKWSDLVGQTMVVRVIEVDRQRRRLIFSEKAASSESRDNLKEKLLEEINVGEVRKGRVTSLADFGAFININGADGLVHLSEISWERIEHPKEVLEVGQEIQVKVISIDQERKRIGLSIRRLKDDPWEDYIKEYQVGQLIEGTITRLTKFGAFARIDDNLEGLIHISELSDRRIEHPKEVVSLDDKITLRIIKIDVDRRRIGLSLRKVESMQYSDMDWELALSEMDEAELEGLTEEEDSPEETPVEEVEMSAPEAEQESEGDEEEDSAEEAPEPDEESAEEAPPDESEPESDEAEEE